MVSLSKTKWLDDLWNGVNSGSKGPHKQGEGRYYVSFLATMT